MNRKNNPENFFPTIDQEISLIANSLSATVHEESVVVRERPKTGTSCVGLVSIFKRADLVREGTETAAYKEAAKDADRRPMLKKPFKATPVVRYAFYPRIDDSRRLGSVAIYGDNVMYQYLMIRKMGVLFGHKVADLKLEMGLRPFAVAKLAA